MELQLLKQKATPRNAPRDIEKWLCRNHKVQETKGAFPTHLVKNCDLEMRDRKPPPGPMLLTHSAPILQKASPGSRILHEWVRFWQSTFLVQWTVEEESRLTFGAPNSQIGAPLFLPKRKTAHILHTSCCNWARTRAQALFKSTLCPKQLGRILAVANARNKGRNAEPKG